MTKKTTKILFILFSLSTRLIASSEIEIASTLKTITTKGSSHREQVITLNQQSLSDLDFRTLKENILELVGIKTRKLVQFVGDSDLFSEEGTKIAIEFVKDYLEGDHLIEYGFTGNLSSDRKKLDVNSLVNTYVEEHPDQANRVIANIVGQSVEALENWGCSASAHVHNFVVVYTNEGTTNFGDDVLASDMIMSPEDGDILVVIEGGAQSWRQMVNVLKNNIPIKALYGVRTPEKRSLFSATEFISVVKDALKTNSDLTSDDVRKLMSTYLETHTAWDTKRNDASTKEALFHSTRNDFIKDDLYKKVLDFVDIFPL